MVTSTMAQTTLRKSCARLTSFERTAQSYKALRMALLALTVIGLPSCITAKYPQDALRCLASLTEPDGLLICPEHRNVYCVKEVSTLSEEDCGRTSYYGDKWNSLTGKCEYRKCEASCAESSWDFEFEGEPYERNRFCCEYNFCNGADKALPRPTMLVCMTGALALILTATIFREQQTG